MKSILQFKGTWLILVVVLVFIDLYVGSVQISIINIYNLLIQGYNPDDPLSVVVWQARLPRVLAALSVGVALPVAGLLMQTFFRNPVAGPDMLGITSGASMMVALVTMGFGLGSMAIANGWVVILAALAGAALVLLLMMLVASRVKDAVSLLIIGLMLGTAISAVTGILQYFSNRDALKLFVLWTFGSLNGVQWSHLMFMLPAAFLTFVGALWLNRALDLLLTGENYAHSMGLNIRKLRIWLIWITAVATGTITAFCGPIAFVGIAVPHLARMLFHSARHRQLITASVLLGMVVMLLCDMISQWPGSSVVLPMNAVTAVMGAPFVMYLVIKNKNLQYHFHS